MFKVGDKVVRIADSYIDIQTGDIVTISKISGDYLALEESSIKNPVFASDYFRKADLRDIVKKIVKDSKKETDKIV